MRVLETDQVLKTVHALIDGFYQHLPYLIMGMVVFLCFLIGASIIKGILVKIGKRTRLDETLACMLGRLASAATILLGLLVTAVIVFPTFKPVDLLAGLGFTSVAIGFAFKDILQNFFAGILILWRKPFRVGDQIRTGEYEGTVEDLNIRSTHILTYDGTRVVIPNGDIYANPVQVMTAFDQRRVTMSVGIGYLDSLEEARSRIHQVLVENEGVLEQPEPWIYVTELAPSSVNFNIYFWTKPTQATVLKVSDQVMSGIKRTLDEGGIDIPYPHQVILFHDATGSLKGDIQRSAYLGSTRKPAAASDGQG